MFTSTTTKKKLSFLLLLAIGVNLLSVGGYGSFYNYFPTEFYTTLMVTPTVKRSSAIVFEEIDFEEPIQYSRRLSKYTVRFDLKSTNQLAKHQFNTINQVAPIRQATTQQTFLFYQYQFSEEEIFSV